MGQKVSAEEKADIRREIYTLYPGLEQQLEMAYSCHDLEGNGILPYTTLEPIIRHLLMQYGLIEYVTRFSNESGALDCNYIKQEADEFGIPYPTTFCAGDLKMQDFKNLAVLWLKKFLHTHADDQAQWMEKLRAEQQEQCENYAKAMREFEAQYKTQQAIYQQGLQDQQRQIQDWNRLLEDAQRTQQQVYEDEVRRMREIQDREATAAQRAQEEEMDLIRKYQSQLEKMAKTDANGKCFVYPAALTPYGACASAGAQEPTRRKINSSRHSQERLPRGCC